MRLGISAGLGHRSKLTDRPCLLYKSVSDLHSLIGSTATILSFGNLYSFFRFKTVFASVVGVFVVGSIICATAPSSVVFIIGRAITGLGSAGMLSGINM